MRQERPKLRLLARAVAEVNGQTFEIDVVDSHYFLVAQARAAGKTILNVRLSTSAAPQILPSQLAGDPMERAESLVKIVRSILVGSSRRSKSSSGLCAQVGSSGMRRHRSGRPTALIVGALNC